MSMSRRTALGAGLAGAAFAWSADHALAQQDPLALPATPLASRATELIDRELAPHLRNHSVRGFLFARAVAAEHGLAPGSGYDDELMYLICALHDIGLGEIANGDQRFEVDGADYAARFLEDNGVTDDRVDVVWDAIAAHTTGLSDSPVYRRRRRPEIWIAVHGIGLDIGGSPADLPPGYADLVHARYPRLGGSRALADSVETQALANPRKAPPGSLPGEILRQRHPELPYLTWDAILATSGWGD
ncbi:HD domain-containing protein [Nocardia amikacinitolerans]|uniref:HD domain-containing protein n=1 Tax=Nocardia amikacinitolerans TaxID=756689 RepID=A0A285KQB0_9NOCA|nr:HD domain-containing protein [Nocardia amikacinitolerans]MCP2293769.1 HD domain-containing protein [Nocardia amikacinitolerans]SNY74822.1 HD domain-containing protein [Nocardia amikacinitolerans]